MRFSCLIWCFQLFVLVIFSTFNIHVLFFLCIIITYHRLQRLLPVYCWHARLLLVSINKCNCNCNCNNNNRNNNNNNQQIKPPVTNLATRDRIAYNVAKWPRVIRKWYQPWLGILTCELVRDFYPIWVTSNYQSESRYAILFKLSCRLTHTSNKCIIMINVRHTHPYTMIPRLYTSRV